MIRRLAIARMQKQLGDLLLMRGLYSDAAAQVTDIYANFLFRYSKSHTAGSADLLLIARTLRALVSSLHEDVPRPRRLALDRRRQRGVGLPFVSLILFPKRLCSEGLDYPLFLSSWFQRAFVVSSSRFWLCRARWL